MKPLQWQGTLVITEKLGTNPWSSLQQYHSSTTVPTQEKRRRQINEKEEKKKKVSGEEYEVTGEGYNTETWSKVVNGYSIVGVSNVTGFR